LPVYYTHLNHQVLKLLDVYKDYHRRRG